MRFLNLFGKRKRKIQDLVDFQRLTETKEPLVLKKDPDHLWVQSRLKDGDVQRLNRLSKMGRELSELISDLRWNHIRNLKSFFQETSGKISCNPLTDDRHRFQAAVEWSTLETFFREIDFRIKRGKEAEDELKKLSKPSLKS